MSSVSALSSPNSRAFFFPALRFDLDDYFVARDFRLDHFKFLAEIFAESLHHRVALRLRRIEKHQPDRIADMIVAPDRHRAPLPNRFRRSIRRVHRDQTACDIRRARSGPSCPRYNPPPRARSARRRVPPAPARAPESAAAPPCTSEKVVRAPSPPSPSSRRPDRADT